MAFKEGDLLKYHEVIVYNNETKLDIKTILGKDINETLIKKLYELCMSVFTRNPDYKVQRDDDFYKGFVWL